MVSWRTAFRPTGQDNNIKKPTYELQKTFHLLSGRSWGDYYLLVLSLIITVLLYVCKNLGIGTFSSISLLLFLSCGLVERGSLDLSRPYSSWDTCTCHTCLIGVKKTFLVVQKTGFRISDHGTSLFLIRHLFNLFSTLLHPFPHLIFIRLFLS